MQRLAAPYLWRILWSILPLLLYPALLRAGYPEVRRWLFWAGLSSGS